MEPVDNDTAGWVELEVSPLRPTDGTSIPFRLVANRFKSSSPDSEAFIHDPLAVLIEAGRTVEALRRVNRGWRVTTHIVNHHAGLRFVHLYAMAVVYDTQESIALTLVKLTQ